MRLPKFTAWDKKHKLFVNLKENCDYTAGFDQEANLYLVRDGNPEPERFILLQSTGLKDKLGVEIYEGDILKDDYGFSGAVSYEIGEYGYKTKNDGWIPLWDISMTQVEVIGNIFEDKELLEDDNNE